jgi:hypothetical protein
LTPIWVLVAALLVAVFAASQLAQTTIAPTGMVAAFVDVNGNDIDDTCEDPETVVRDEAAAAEAEAAIDLDGDGTISVSEAAQSDRIGGTNCNHGGYVSWVAQGSCPDPVSEPAPALVTGPAVGAVVATTCEDETTTPEEEAAAPAADCVEVAPPERDPALDEQKNGHGKWVSSVAQSDAKGGKNCNHGGAVSEAAKKDHEAAKAAREAAKAERDAAKAERDAAKAERKAAREAAKAARDAAKATKQQGKGKSTN